MVAVACSGGRDSMALLHATVQAARAVGGLGVVALHVHHGLQPAADAWAAHVARWCEDRAARGDPVSCRVRHLHLRPAQGDSVEAVAREARLQALQALAQEVGAGLLLLAHHRQDQAETVLLQALRGAGVAGLSAMPLEREVNGVRWVRPWIDRPRHEIEAYVQADGVPYVDDDSNGDPRWARNRLRLQVWPALIAAFPDAELSLSHVAQRMADARACLSAWGEAGLAACLDDSLGGGLPVLRVAVWQAGRPAERREWLRAWFHRVSGRPMPAAAVLRLERELQRSTVGRWAVAGGQVSLYRGVLRWDTAWAAAPPPAPLAACPWSVPGPGRWPVPAGRGWLLVDPVEEGGVPLALLARCEWRTRTGAERFQLGPARPPRLLKKQFQAQGVPAWAREGPLLWSGDQLVFVPGLGVDARVVAPPGAPQVGLAWVGKPVTGVT